MKVSRVNERIMVVRVRVGKAILNLISVYAPQVKRRGEEKKIVLLHCVRNRFARDWGKRYDGAGWRLKWACRRGHRGIG
jgi:hypothetical protein